MSESRPYYTRVIPAQEGLADEVAIQTLSALVGGFESATILKAPEKHSRGGYTLHVSVNADLVEKLFVYLHENGFWPCV